LLARSTVMPAVPAPFSIARAFSRVSRTGPRRAVPICARPTFQPPLRYTHSTAPSHPSQIQARSSISSSHVPRPPHAPRQPDQPAYEMTFTCTPCGTRSTHRISKQGYHHGSVLITCPECRNRHVISDHLNIFGDKSMTIEDLMRERGQLVKKGTLSEDGDLEFWEDGSTTQRVKPKRKIAEEPKEN